MPFLQLHGCPQRPWKCKWDKSLGRLSVPNFGWWCPTGGTPEDVQFPISEEDIRQKMISSAYEDVVLEEDDGIYEKGDELKSIHH